MIAMVFSVEEVDRAVVGAEVVAGIVTGDGVMTGAGAVVGARAVARALPDKWLKFQAYV